MRAGKHSRHEWRDAECGTPSQGVRRSAVGFTLLEVIISLSLTLLLLTAVYGAIRLQYRISNSGREQMERAQLARAVLRQIESDIRCVIWEVQKPAESDDGSDSEQSSSQAVDDTESMSSSSSPEPAEILSTDDAFSSGGGGIFGDSQNLVLHISRPSRALVYATSLEDEAAAAGGSDEVSVNYFIADAQSGGLAAAVAQQNGGGSSILGGAVGLARLESNRLAIEMAGSSGAAVDVASDARILAPEVVSIEFAYWDGIEWLASWDSQSSGTLPSAIGITIGIDSETALEDRTMAGQLQQTIATGKSANMGQPVMISYVVALPLAEPYVSEASY